MYFVNSFPRFLDSSKLNVFANDNFKFDDYGEKFSKRIENTVVKREIAHYVQFLFFPQCFQKAYAADQFLLFLQCFKRLVLQTSKNQCLFGKGLRYIISNDLVYCMTNLE